MATVSDSNPSPRVPGRLIPLHGSTPIPSRSSIHPEFQIHPPTSPPPSPGVRRHRLPRDPREFARSCAVRRRNMGAPRRAAPVPSARPSSKRPRGDAPAGCGAVARESSSARRAVADQKLSAPGPKCTKVVRNGIVPETEVTVTAVGGRVAPPNGRPFVKRPQVVEPAAATCCTMAREKKSARRAGAGEEFSAPIPKRAKVTRDSVETTSVDPALGTLRERMAAELDALHALVRKAELLSSGKSGRSMAAAEPRSEAPAEASIKTPPAKRRKVYDLAKVAKLVSPEDDNELIDICGGVSPVAILEVSPVVSLEKEVETGNSEIRDLPEDDNDNEFIDICGGVSPVAILKASPVVSVEKAGETDNSESEDIPEDDNELVDICGGVSPVVPVEKDCESGNSPSSSSDSGSSSSGDSDSDSDSESDRDETVDHPVPQPALPEENGTSVQPAPEPASEKVAQSSTEPEKLPTAALIAKAKVRRKLLEMERAVLPDESIHPQDLNDLGIVEYGRPGIMRQLGLFLKADA
ncbi:surface protein-like [Panicum miliaceum]|uniref:Surface protein-like n=1 Tax=Panicum miliaceum TaxID=4540 RepID=A0A3L6RQZ6_PANMI|nr:surface protein-like [Panicum miliaceum]